MNIIVSILKYKIHYLPIKLMNMKKPIFFPLALLITYSSWSQENVQADFLRSAEANDWGFTITPYALLAGMSTARYKMKS